MNTLARPIANTHAEATDANDWRHERRRAAPAAPLQAVGNLALQSLFANGALRRKALVGAADDPAEAAAERMADTALLSKPAGCTCAPGEPACPSCRAATAGPIHRKARSHDLLKASPNLSLGHERALGNAERAFFEAHYHADLSEVRIHDNPQAAASAAQLNARAFTLGSRIAFGAGEYRPHTGDGKRLLGHELAHVMQQDAGGATPVIRRDELPPGSQSPLTLTPPSPPQVCTAEPAAKAAPQVCKAPAADPANPTVLKLTGTLDERVASFKQLVKTTAIHRLLANKRNLGLWAGVVEEIIPAEDIAALGMMQTGASRPYFELQDIRDPMLRELRADQGFGRFRACTGCHLETQISASRADREAESLGGWATPNEMRAGIRPASRFDIFPGGRLSQAELVELIEATTPPGSGSVTTQPTPAVPATGSSFSTFSAFGRPRPGVYQPPSGSAEARMNQLFPDPVETRAALKRVAPIMQALGPEGYQVLPATMLGTLETGTASDVRKQILKAIVERQGNYQELIGKINSNEIGYEHFGPVIKSLYPLADSEVRDAIQAEMDRHAFWAKVEEVVVATLTALALLLTIFPPTTAAGIAFLAALDVTLGYYGVKKGEEAMRIGAAYRLGAGADDVFTRAQQQAGDAMVLSGFISIATGYLGMGSGFLRMDAALARFAPVAEASNALTRTGAGSVARTIQQGEYVITITEDGAMLVTVASRPDLLIMVRGDTATLYQLLEGGGMRVAATATIPGKAAAANPLLLTAGGEANAASTALVPVGPQSLSVRPPAALPGPAASLADQTPQVWITPPPKVPLQLGPGNPTSMTWDDISRLRQPLLWQERQTYMQELYGAPGEQHYPIPNTGGRYVDVPAPASGGQLLAGEVKSYNRWIGVPGQRGGIPNSVGLSDRLQEQINRDVWLRDNVPGYDPRWMFTDAPPAAELRQALYDARITFIVYQ